MVQVAIKETKPVTLAERLKWRETMLEVLARAAGDSDFLGRLTNNPTEAVGEYYTLTQEEVAALVSGDIEKIESWLGKLDQRHVTWLWCRLSQEKSGVRRRCHDEARDSSFRKTCSRGTRGSRENSIAAGL